MGALLILFIVALGASIFMVVTTDKGNKRETTTLRILGAIYYGMAAYCVLTFLIVLGER